MIVGGEKKGWMLDIVRMAERVAEESREVRIAVEFYSAGVGGCVGSC